MWFEVVRFVSRMGGKGRSRDGHFHSWERLDVTAHGSDLFTQRWLSGHWSVEGESQWVVRTATM